MQCADPPPPAAPAPRQPGRSPASSRPAARSSPLAGSRRLLLSLSRRGALCAARAHSDSSAEPPRRRRRGRASERASGGAAACGRASSAPALVPHPGSGDGAELRAWGPRPADLRGGVGGAESGPCSSAAAAAPARTPPFLQLLLLAEPLPDTSGGAQSQAETVLASCPVPLGRRGRSLPVTAPASTHLLLMFPRQSWLVPVRISSALGSLLYPQGHADPQLTCFPYFILRMQGTRPSCKLEPVVPKKALQVLSYKRSQKHRVAKNNWISRTFFHLEIGFSLVNAGVALMSPEA